MAIRRRTPRGPYHRPSAVREAPGQVHVPHGQPLLETEALTTYAGKAFPVRTGNLRRSLRFTYIASGLTVQCRIHRGRVSIGGFSRTMRRYLETVFFLYRLPQRAAGFQSGGHKGRARRLGQNPQHRGVDNPVDRSVWYCPRRVSVPPNLATSLGLRGPRGLDEQQKKAPTLLTQCRGFCCFHRSESPKEGLLYRIEPQ